MNIFGTKKRSLATSSFRQLAGSEMVDLHVGPKKELFHVHKKLICDRVPYFQKMFKGGFAEASSNSADFPTDPVECFNILIEWVYNGSLRPYVVDGITKKGNYDPISLYQFLDKICLLELADELIDMLRAQQRQHHTCSLLSVIQASYKQSPENSGCRLFFLRSLMYVFGTSFEDELESWRTDDILDMLKLDDNSDLAADFYIKNPIRQISSRKTCRSKDGQ